MKSGQELSAEGDDAILAGHGPGRGDGRSPLAVLRRLRVVAWRLKIRLQASLNQSASFASVNFRLVGVVAVVTHPLYYLVWTTLMPAEFESPWLRLFGALEALPLVFYSQISDTFIGRRWLTGYWFVSLVFQLPFFFVFMSLMNGFSVVWSMSTMAAAMLLVLLVFDWLFILLLAFFGSLAAWCCFWLVNGNYHSEGLPLTLLIPIYLFALIAGSVFNYKSELLAREKLSAMTDAIGTMAHELRTPLLGISSGARGLENYLPILIEGFEMARANDLPVRPIRAAHYRELRLVLERIRAETKYSNVMLDMLLVNSSRTRLDRSTFGPIRMNDCVSAALERYPFQSEAQRERVHWDPAHDFVFVGSELMMVHVLFNLLKNALHFIDQAQDGRIRMWVESLEPGWNTLHFIDTGPGIAREKLPRIFDRFYSGLPRGQGTGIGLAFVQLVMNGFEGHIRCRSVLGQFTEFVLTFPAVDTPNHV